MAGYTTGTGNELTASPGYTYTYDNEGNLSAQTNTSSHVVTTYSYDYRNRLTQVTVAGTVTASYTYDGLDRRIGFDDNGTQTWTVFDGSSPVANPYADFNGSGTLLTRYLYGPAVDEVFARTSSGGTTAWYLPDKLGSVRDIVDSSGSALDHVVYDSFGNIVTETNATNGDRFKFTGMEYDAAIGLYYDHARWYGPGAGRFVQRDPIGFAGDHMNVYRYALNSPTNYTDVNGMYGGQDTPMKQPPRPPKPPRPNPSRSLTTQEQQFLYMMYMAIYGANVKDGNRVLMVLASIYLQDYNEMTKAERDANDDMILAGYAKMWGNAQAITFDTWQWVRSQKAVMQQYS